MCSPMTKNWIIMDEPMMEGSDDEFSDLEVDEDEDDTDSAIGAVLEPILLAHLR